MTFSGSFYYSGVTGALGTFSASPSRGAGDNCPRIGFKVA